MEGKHAGDWVGYHENGQMKYECSYVGGKRDGKILEWFKNGQKRVDGTMVGGKLQGEVLIWNADGTLNEADSGTYSAGKKRG